MNISILLILALISCFDLENPTIESAFEYLFNNTQEKESLKVEKAYQIIGVPVKDFVCHQFEKDCNNIIQNDPSQKCNQYKLSQFKDEDFKDQDSKQYLKQEDVYCWEYPTQTDEDFENIKNQQDL